MANDLKILVTGQLNIGKTISEINTALRGIEKKINKININVQVGQQAQTALSNLTQQINNLNNASRQNSSQNMSNQISNIGNSARQASGHVQTFGSMMQQAFTKFPINLYRWE